MGHHKRRRPKNRRAGCLMCKMWKANGAKENSPWIATKQSRQIRVTTEEQMEEALVLGQGKDTDS